MSSPINLHDSHKQKIVEISAKIKSWKNNPRYIDKRLRFNRGGTHSTRKKASRGYYEIDVSFLNKIIEINPAENYLLVEPNVCMDALVEETMKYNLVPPVVPEFPGITVGGAIQGAALESSSVQYGQFNAPALEYEVITASGQIVTASPQNNSDLFYGIAGSYGSLGLLTLVKLKLVTAGKFMELSYVQVHSFHHAIEAIKDYSQKFDYIDGIMFSSKKGIIMVGQLVDDCRRSKPQTFTSGADPWFYKYAEEFTEETAVYKEFVPLTDYFFRYNRGAFWMGKYFFKFMKIPNNKFTRLLFNPFLNTRKLYEVLHDMNWTQKFFIQDIYFPIDRVEQYLRYVNDKLKVYPIWLCPVKNTTNPEKLSPNYLFSNLILNVGVWGTLPMNLNYIQINRDVQSLTEQLGGRKMLYAQNFYSREEFWRIYDQDWYRKLRLKYEAEGNLSDIYERTNVYNRSAQTLFKGFWKLLWSFLSTKNLNS